MTTIEMPEACDLDDVKSVSEIVPELAPTYIGARDMGTKGQSIPENFVSYRVTTDSRDVVFDLFKGCRCVIAEEHSCQGVQHYHIVVEGHDQFEIVKKRLLRAKLGVNKYWSKKNHGDFYAAVAYTIKAGEYWTRKGFSVHTDYAEINNCWIFKVEPVCSETGRDTEKDWMLTYNNILRVAHNYSKKKGLKTDDLGAVLASLTEYTRWIPSPQMMKAGLDPWFFKMYKFRVGSTLTVPDWWTPHSI
jgi:hypothetical protein